MMFKNSGIIITQQIIADMHVAKKAIAQYPITIGIVCHLNSYGDFQKGTVLTVLKLFTRITIAVAKNIVRYNSRIIGGDMGNNSIINIKTHTHVIDKTRFAFNSITKNFTKLNIICQ